jgi:chemotaxis protein methyltransferase CheR
VPEWDFNFTREPLVMNFWQSHNRERSSAGPVTTDPEVTEFGGLITDGDFDYLCRLIYEQCRINLGPEKRALVTSRLAKRLRHHGFKTYAEYCALLRSPAGAEEIQNLIDRISTNHTLFFREMKHFDFLRETVIPKWQAEKRQGPFRIWSAASSSGEEAYSIAIHLAEHFAPAESGRWRIEATDVSMRVLETAQAGVYDASRIRTIPDPLLRRYFQRGVKEWHGHYRLKEELRRCVNFQRWNLLEGNYPFTQPFDLIFCRNVMIYFDRPTQETLVRQLSATLISQGWLFVGHSESLSGVKHDLKSLRPSIYLKAKS